MIDSSIITNATANAQQQQAQNWQNAQALSQLIGNKFKTNQLTQMRQLATDEERKNFANDSIFSSYLNEARRVDGVNAASQVLANQKTLSEINKNNGDASKSLTQSQGFGLDNAGKTLSAMQTAIGYGAQNGDKNAVFHALDMAKSSGLLTPEQYKNEVVRVNGFQSPDEVKQYALSSQIANSKDPAQYLMQTANNAANNVTTQRGQDISAQTTQRGQDMTANTAAASLAQNQAQFDAKSYVEQNKPLDYFTAADGTRYAVYPGGKGIPITNNSGQVIKEQPKNGNSQAEEKNRLDRVDVILPEIKKLLPDATHSYAGKGLDMLGNVVGYSTNGQQATAKLKTLSGQLVSMMPKMSGPQSDKDVAMYKEMAGNLSDDTLPIQTRLAALEAIESLTVKYRDLNNENVKDAPSKSQTTQLQNSNRNQSDSRKPSAVSFFN